MKINANYLAIALNEKAIKLELGTNVGEQMLVYLPDLIQILIIRFNYLKKRQTRWKLNIKINIRKQTLYKQT